MKEVTRVRTKYQIIFDELKSNILSGTYSVGEQIPTESALQEIYGVSRQTVRKAILELSNEGSCGARRARALMSATSSGPKPETARANGRLA